MSISYTADQLQKKFQGAPGASGFARIAETLREEGRLEEAVALCQEGLRRKPQDVTGHLVLGKCLLDMDRLEDAREQLEGVLRQDPRCLSAMHLLARLMTRLQWGEAAAAYYRSILELEPWDTETLARFRETSPSGAAGFVPAAAGTGLPGGDPAPPIQTLEALDAAAPSGPEVEEFDLNEVTGFASDDSTPADLAGALEEISLEDALSEPALEPRAFAPSRPMPDLDEPKPLDILVEAAPAPESGSDEPAPISGDDVGDRLDSLFGAEDDKPIMASPASSAEPVDPDLADATLQLKALRDQGAPPASDTGSATTFSGPAEDFASDSAVDAGAEAAPDFAAGRMEDLAPGPVDVLAGTENLAEETVSPLETSIFAGGDLLPPEARVSGEDIEARLDDLFSLHDTSTQPVMKAIPDETGPRNEDSTAFATRDAEAPDGTASEFVPSMPEAVETWSGAAPTDAPMEADAEETPIAEGPAALSAGDPDRGAPRPGDEEAFPAAGTGTAIGMPSEDAGVTGQDVADKLDSLFGAEPLRREESAREDAASDPIESGSASWAVVRPAADGAGGFADRTGNDGTGTDASATAGYAVSAWEEGSEPSQPPAANLMTTESFLPPGPELEDGPAITGEDIEDRLDSLFDLADEGSGMGALARSGNPGEDPLAALPLPARESRPVDALPEVTSVEPQGPADAGPEGVDEDAGRTMMLPAGEGDASGWLSRRADEPGAQAEAEGMPLGALPDAGDTLFIGNEDVIGVEPGSGQFPGATDTVGLEMVDGADIADRLDQIFAPEGSDPRPEDSPAAAARAAAEAAIARGEVTEDGTLASPEPEAAVTVEEPELPAIAPAGMETGTGLEEAPLDEVALFAQDPAASLSLPDGDLLEPSGIGNGPSETVISGEDIDSRLSEIFDAPAVQAETPHFLANSGPVPLPDSDADVSGAAATGTEYDFLPSAPAAPTPAADAGTSASETGKPAMPSLSPLQDEEEGSPEEEENAPQSAAGANVATVTLAEIYFQQGLREQALQIYRQLFEREPGNDSVRKRIQEIEASKPETGTMPGSDPRRPRPGLKVPKRKK